MIDRILHHAVVVVTEGESFRMKEAKTRGGGPPKRKGWGASPGGDFQLAKTGDFEMAIDTGLGLLLL
jgi:hypothetical protein